MGGTGAAKAVRHWFAETWLRFAETWLLLQGVAAATAAWVIAERAAGHNDPFFAPIAAVIALGFAQGERGLSAVRLVAGVGIGVTAGEIGVAVLGSGYESLALATLAALVVTRSLHANRLVRNQAAASAILTVAVADGQAGLNRIIDVLIGAGVALLFSQVLFSPEPVTLLSRAEAAALKGMGNGLEATGQALERGDGRLGAEVTARLRDVGDQLRELERVRQASIPVARHSLLWRSRMSSTAQVKENAGHLELLGASCLMLMRAAIDVGPPERPVLAPRLRQLAQALTALATDPGDSQVRQRAVDLALDADRHLVRDEAPPQVAMASAVASLRMVVLDIMVFAGVDRRRR